MGNEFPSPAELSDAACCRTRDWADFGGSGRQYPAQASRAVSYHALKERIFELLWSQRPLKELLEQLFAQGEGPSRLYYASGSRGTRGVSPG